MRKLLWIAGIFLILSTALAACGGQPTPVPTAVPPTQPAAQEEAEPVEPTSPPEEAEAEGETQEEAEPAQEEAEEESPEVIFARAMEGVQTNVERFIDGFPMPEGAAITIVEPDRLEMIQGYDIPTSIDWARETYTNLGLIEIPELGYETENSASLWFGGYPTGQAIHIRIQRVTDTTTTFKITFEDM